MTRMILLLATIAGSDMNVAGVAAEATVTKRSADDAQTGQAGGELAVPHALAQGNHAAFQPHNFAGLPAETLAGLPEEIAIGLPAKKLPVRPATLPQYKIDINLDSDRRFTKVHQTVRWTNTASTPTHQLIFHVYPRHRPRGKLMETYHRTLESLRVDARTGVDQKGRRIKFQRVESAGTELKFEYDRQIDTLMRVQLPGPVGPGQSVEVSLDYTLDLPPLQGRFGRYRGVTNLLNWYPLLAYYGDDGWEAHPYIAWHQPWLNEAGNYRVNLTLPAKQKVATSGQVVQRSVDDQGQQHLSIEGQGLRDFSITASQRFEVRETIVNGVKLQVFAFPEHRFYAKVAMQVAAECIAQYEDWFGPYPHPEFKIVETYLGWNGNESSGILHIDERVFDSPQVAVPYFDNLLSHEICHQWWYSTVGTDGFREPWMDEGPVTYLTELRMERKYGRKPLLIDWPHRLSWIPNVNNHTFQHIGYYIYREKGGEGRALTTLPEAEHVHNLFFLAYDRGSKVVQMLHHRLGDQRFFDFLRHVYATYQFRIMWVKDFQRELEQFTGESWSQFFEQWLYSSKIADWEVADVSVRPLPTGYETSVTVRQLEQINEPVEIGYMLEKDGPVVERILLDPDGVDCTIGTTTVRRTGKCQWEVRFVSCDPPAQVVIDPDNWILDANLLNNRWRCDPVYRWKWIYTPLDEIPLVHPLDRLSIVAGPNVDQYGRIGMRGALISPTRFRISPYLAYTPGNKDNLLALGVNSIIYNQPFPKWSIGARYEHSLASDLYNDPEDQGYLFLRYTHIPTTSFTYPNLAFFDCYFRFGDNFYFRFGENFWPDEDRLPPKTPGVEDYRDIRSLGLRCHLDSRTPYWNPNRGMALDAIYEHGVQAFGGGQTYDRVFTQLSAVRRLSRLPGFLSETKLAGRVAGGYGSPSNGEHFRFGGMNRFRGQRSENTEGSKFWIASADWRFPLLTDLQMRFYDNFALLRSINGSLFYDVGESYIFNNSQGFDQAIGAGLYFDMPLFSFIENLTTRLELGHSLRYDSTILWFGWYHAF